MEIMNEKKECSTGCCYGMNSKCEVLEIKSCGCQVHQKSIYFSGSGYMPENPHTILCKIHKPAPIKRGDGWCGRCQSYCFGDCRAN